MSRLAADAVGRADCWTRRLLRKRQPAAKGRASRCAAPSSVHALPGGLLTGAPQKTASAQVAVLGSVAVSNRLHTSGPAGSAIWPPPSTRVG